MISVNEAKQLVNNHSVKLESAQVDLYEATGLILAEDIYSPSDSPQFNQSAMDGYAYKFSTSTSEFEISGEVAAGDSSQKFNDNTAVRIFTGAQVPNEFDTVIMQEKTEVNGKKLIIKDTDQKKGMNIRLQGSQIKKGDLAINSGTKITAGIAGFLAGIGIAKVHVVQMPRISIISTGNELISPGKELTSGKVYECNTYSLNAALVERGIKPKNIYRVLDNQLATEEAVNKAMIDSDIIILSGGVSVGDYDFVAKALEACEIKCIFHKVKQKPGKPLYFGVKNKTLVFGLPGNPAALLTCFYQYVLPAIKKMSGHNISDESKLLLTLCNSYSKKAGLTHFLKGKISNHEVTILPAQESYLMSSFTQANCLVQLDEQKTIFEKGELVEVHPIN